MKTLIATIFVLTFSLPALFAGPDVITDPIHAYAVFHALSSDRVIYKWEVDLNNDGRKEVLLATKSTPAELEQDERESNSNPQTPNERDFTVYVPHDNGSGYFESRRADKDGVIIAVMGVDITQCFVGKITQLNKWGLVTVDIEPEGRRNPAITSICAYTLEGGHLKLTILAKYDPSKGPNEIYNQYLSESKRMKVQLQEVRP